MYMGIVDCWCGVTSIFQGLNTCFGLQNAKSKRLNTPFCILYTTVSLYMLEAAGQRHSWIIPVWIGWMHNGTEQLCTTYHSCPWFFSNLIGLILWNLYNYNIFFRDADAYITPICVVIWRAPLNCRLHRDQFVFVLYEMLFWSIMIILKIP